MPTCIVIACGNGYGHTRRCLLVSNELARRGWNVHLYAPAAPVRKFSELYGRHRGVTHVELCTNTTADAFRNGTLPAWINALPPLDAFDVVVSDNLPDILEKRADAILSGSFLWHQAVSGVDPGTYARTEELLRIHRPLMIASELFVTPEIRSVCRVMTTGLCVHEEEEPPPQPGSDLLVSSGMAGVFADSYRALVAQMVADGVQPPFRTVWVDPNLLPANPPDWMVPAAFDPGMYRGLKAAICRPGVGTMTDCLCRGVRIFAAYEEGNREMEHNGRVLVTRGVGESADTPAAALSRAVRFAHDEAAQLRHAEAVARIDLGGVSAIADALCRSLESPRKAGTR